MSYSLFICFIGPVFLQNHISGQDNSNDPTVLPTKKFSIGFGDGGKPIHFVLPKDVKIDLGYLKIFATTKPVDFYPILQESPFVEQQPGSNTQARATNSYIQVAPTKVLPYYTRVFKLETRRRRVSCPSGQMRFITSRNFEDYDTPTGPQYSEVGWGTLNYAVIQKFSQLSLLNMLHL